jgi:hypothetical protein
MKGEKSRFESKTTVTEIDEAFMSAMLPKSMALGPGDSFEGFSIREAPGQTGRHLYLNVGLRGNAESSKAVRNCAPSWGSSVNVN